MDSEVMETFNPAQRAAVEYCEGASLVIAGAGSGKTRVLTHKIAYLMELGYEPWSILALTFTNKAANEMKQRIAKIVGDERARYLWMGTFHSIFLRILRKEHEAIGFSSDFTIYDSSDSKSLIKAIIKEMGLDDKKYKPSTVMSRISNAKNHLVTAEKYVNTPGYYKDDCHSGTPEIGTVYKRYSDRCRQANAMDFDDILLYTFALFESNEDVRMKYVKRFKYVLVDEYQDTNFAQHRIVWQLTKERQLVCVVGDDAQSIYSFRGANIDNILTFQDLYKDCKVFKLEQNYRSTKMIVDAANSLIHKNQGQIKKDVFSENSDGERICVSEAYSDLEEGQIVVRQISDLRKKEHCEYSDFAILYRTNAQSRVFEEALRKVGMPYRIYGGLSFYQRKEIKDIIAYFRLTVNPDDEEALKRVINYPARGIGNTTLQKIVGGANANGVSLWTVIKSPSQYGVSISKATENKLMQFCMLIEMFSHNASEVDAEEVGRLIVKESGIANDIYSDSTPENQARQENVEEMVNGIHDFVVGRKEEGNDNVSLSDYLSEVSLLSDMDTDKGDDEHKVTMMTIHSAKGLEFPTVFIVGLEENLFPNQMAGSSLREMEEERRLFYVAVTRAERHCFLSYAKSRYRFGQVEFGTPSRFISDIDPKYLDMRSSVRASRNVSASDDVDLPWKRKFSSFGDDEPEYMRSSSRQSSYGSHSSYSSSQSSPYSRSSRQTSQSPYSSRSQQESNYGAMPRVSNTGGHSSFTPKTTSSAPSMPPVPSAVRRVSRVDDANVKSATPKSPSANVGVAVGKRIEHQRFGVGVIEKLEGSADNLKATIRFTNVGVKQLLLKFAPFKLLD